jgi:hypothetical protein
MTVGDLVEKLKDIDPSFDICVDIEQECVEVKDLEVWKSTSEDGSFVSILVDF